jgi:hypothetical protein
MEKPEIRKKIAKIVDSTNGINDLQQALEEWWRVPKCSVAELSQAIPLLSASAVRLSKGDEVAKKRADILRAWVLKLRVENRRIAI